jgi:pimeloyl-ACP methyl ester carboxylesterase
MVFGESDMIVPVGQGRDLARRIPGARVVEVPGEGHLLVRARLEEILDRLEAQAGTVPSSPPLERTERPPP